MDGVFIAMTFRGLARRRRLAPPHAGFAGPGHTAVEVLGSSAFDANDPFVFLMDDRLDFCPGQRLGGGHPHAGLETVTFVLDGSLDDRDEGLLQPGDAVWMTAGRGIVHNENVFATGPGRFLQLWITLPERERDAAPRLDVLRRADMPVYHAAGVEARLYSGSTNGLTSPTRNHVPVTLVDIRLEAGASFDQELPASYNGFLFPLEGEVHVVDAKKPLCVGEVGWLDKDCVAPTLLRIVGGNEGARVLLYAGLRQNEPMIQHGPFVAGSADAIQRMYRDYRAGRFVRVSMLVANAAPSNPRIRPAAESPARAPRR